MTRSELRQYREERKGSLLDKQYRVVGCLGHRTLYGAQMGALDAGWSKSAVRGFLREWHAATEKPQPKWR